MSMVISRMANEVKNKEYDSSRFIQDYSNDTQIRYSSAKKNVFEMETRDSKSHMQSKILEYLLKTLKETGTCINGHIRHVGLENRLIFYVSFMGIGNESFLHMNQTRRLNIF